MAKSGSGNDRDKRRDLMNRRNEAARKIRSQIKDLRDRGFTDSDERIFGLRASLARLHGYGLKKPGQNGGEKVSGAVERVKQLRRRIEEDAAKLRRDCRSQDQKVGKKDAANNNSSDSAVADNGMSVGSGTARRRRLLPPIPRPKPDLRTNDISPPVLPQDRKKRILPAVPDGCKPLTLEEEKELQEGLDQLDYYNEEWSSVDEIKLQHRLKTLSKIRDYQKEFDDAMDEFVLDKLELKEELRVLLSDAATPRPTASKSAQAGPAASSGRRGDLGDDSARPASRDGSIDDYTIYL